MKIRPLGAEFWMQTNGRTDKHEALNSRFSRRERP